MSLEAPFLAAVIARGQDPKQNLAAFGVAYAMAILVESPVIMILSASTALVAGRESFRRLRNFTNVLCVAVSGLMAALLLTSAWSRIAADAIGLPPQVVDLTQASLLVLLPWPAAIGYRRFWQGLLIRHGSTRRVAYGTVMRLAAMSATALLLFSSTTWPGAVIAAVALTAGVSVEALFARAMAAEVRGDLLSCPAESETPPSYSEIGRFYWPLALTSAISLSIHPMVSFSLGRAPFPLESLAVMPVVHSLSFVFRSAGLSFQEVAIALLTRHAGSLHRVLRFSLGLGLAASAGMGLIVFTPLASLWFERLAGLSSELAGVALPAARLLALLPALSVALSLERAMLVHARRTTAITRATLVEVLGTVVVLVVLIGASGIVGATAAALALLLGRIAGNLWMLPACRRWHRELADPGASHRVG
jgi:hypothetical protein